MTPGTLGATGSVRPGVRGPRGPGVGPNSVAWQEAVLCAVETWPEPSVSPAAPRVVPRPGMNRYLRGPVPGRLCPRRTTGACPAPLWARHSPGRPRWDRLPRALHPRPVCDVGVQPSRGLDPRTRALPQDCPGGWGLSPQAAAAWLAPWCMGWSVSSECVWACDMHMCPCGCLRV